MPVVRLSNQIEIARAGAKAGKGRGFAAMQDLKSQRAVEADGARHGVGAERDGADPLDHDVTSWESDRPIIERELSLLTTIDGLSLKHDPEKWEPVFPRDNR